MDWSVLSGSGVRVSRLALGTATFGVAPAKAEARRLIDAALDSGVNFIDTANSYGNQSRFDRAGAPDAARRESAEEIVGAALGARRGEVILSSKVSEPVGSGPNDYGLGRPHVIRMLERSLTRLRTDYLDVYYAHHPDPDTDIAEVLFTFDDLIRQGKIRYYALSTFDGWQLTEAILTAEKLGLRPPVCQQTRYSLAKRWVEQEVLPAARRFGLSTMVFSPLGGGLFADGTKDRAYAGDARWGGQGFTDNESALAARVAKFGAEWGQSSSAIALAWLLAKPGISSAIVGPESVAELAQLLPAADLALTEAQVGDLDALVAPQPVLWS